MGKPMRITGLIYIDHQDRVRYPILQVARSLQACDHVYVLVSNQANAAWVENELGRRAWATIHVIGKGIETPSDIARAWNASIDWVRAADPWDYLLISPADTLATDESSSYAFEFAKKSGSRGRAAQFPIQESKLYHDFGNGWGHTLIGRDWPGRFSELCDGSKLEGENLDMQWWTAQSTLHIGYLSIRAAYLHQRHEASPKLWGNAYGWLGESARIYEQDGPDAFVRYMLPVLKSVHGRERLVPVEEKDSRFRPIIRELGLEEERDRVVAIAKELGLA